MSLLEGHAVERKAAMGYLFQVSFDQIIRGDRI
jgi:hypothetical protein